MQSKQMLGSSEKHFRISEILHKEIGVVLRFDKESKQWEIRSFFPVELEAVNELPSREMMEEWMKVSPSAKVRR